MTIKLVQKQLFKSSREFEIADDLIHVRIRSPFKAENSSLALSMLNPEPVVNGQCLEFHGRVKHGPLLSLYLNKPDRDSFDRFVGELKQRAREEYSASAGLSGDSRPAGLAGNSYADPPEFGEPRKPGMDKTAKPIDIASIDVSIRMLRQYLDVDEIEPLLDSLEALKSDPESESRFDRLVNAFDNLGIRQGAVLTYAPYVGILLSDDPFDY